MARSLFLACTYAAALLLVGLSGATEYQFSIPLKLDLKEDGGMKEFTFQIKLGQAPEEALKVYETALSLLRNRTKMSQMAQHGSFCI